MYQIYLQQALNTIPQVLSRVDQDIYSPTYGCFDRLFWGWKLKDFPDATLQRAVYPLALLWQQKNNTFYRSKLLQRIIKAAILYWTNIQHKNGSFDQAFPFEYSYGAAAFTVHPILATYQLINDFFTSEDRQKLEACLKRCADFLVKADETHALISNHLAGAALSLLQVGDFFNNKSYKTKANTIIARILNFQSQEGWFLEYEGFDAGYQTLATYYLAEYWRLTKDTELLKSLERSIHFLSHFIHPDGTLGGEYGSRNTELYYPAGFDILSSEIPLANMISRTMLSGIKRQNTVSLNGVDTGNLIPLLANYLLAYNERLQANQSGIKEDNLSYQSSSFDAFFPHANIYVKNTARYYLIIGISKGGVIKIYDKKKNKWRYSDGGYIGQLSNSVFITSQAYVKNIAVEKSDTLIEFQSTFYQVLRDIPTPFKFLLLRLLNLSLMRSRWIGNLVKQKLVRLLISGKRSYPVFLTRKIAFTDNEIVITDLIKKANKVSFKWLQFGKPFTTIHMASAKYFQMTKLADTTAQSIDIDELNQTNFIESVTEIKINE